MVRGGKRPDRRRRRGIRDYPMWLAATVAVGLLALPWVIELALAPDHHLNVTQVGILAAVSIPLSGLWLTWVTVAKGGGSGALATGLSMAQVADQIAVAIGEQWAVEAAVRRLNDPYPLPVSWNADTSLTDSWDSLWKLASSGAGWPVPPPAGTWAPGPDDLAGKDGELVEVLTRVPTGRLVVLGEPGAGKTMLMVRLVLDLLARRAAGGPVPFLTSIASWDPGKQDLRDWLGAQLLIAHPALGIPPADRAEPTHAAALLASGLILPVLDGLDEIPEQVRGRAIGRINDALRPGEQVVVTSRIRQYRDAVRPQEGNEVTLRPPRLSSCARWTSPSSAVISVMTRRARSQRPAGIPSSRYSAPIPRPGRPCARRSWWVWPAPSTTRGPVSRPGPCAIQRNCATRPWATKPRRNPCCTTRLSRPPTAITPLGGGRRGRQNRGWCFLPATWSGRSATLTLRGGS